jgi:hypothetical protein
VGFDESARSPIDPEKIRGVVRHLRSLLQGRGMLLATTPVGYNPSFDQAAPSLFSEVRYLRRLSFSNRWSACGEAECRSCKYDWPFPGANALAVWTAVAAP